MFSKMYGDVIRKVYVVINNNMKDFITPKTIEFIENKFNSLRNYREFETEVPVKVKVITSEELVKKKPNFKTEEACLFIGSGRIMDKKSYLFAKECLNGDVPIYFIRSNSLSHCTGSVLSGGTNIWSTNILAVNTNNKTKTHMAPEKYFMQIPEEDDLILAAKQSDDNYALFPAMSQIL